MVRCLPGTPRPTRDPGQHPRGNEPWPSYDEQSVAEITEALRAADDDSARQVAAYERGHKNRAGILKAAQRDAAKA